MKANISALIHWPNGPRVFVALKVLPVVECRAKSNVKRWHARLHQSYLILRIFALICSIRGLVSASRSQVKRALPNFQRSHPSSSFTVSTCPRGLLPLILSLWISGNPLTFVSLPTSKYRLVCNVTVSRTSSCSFISVFST